MKQLKSLLFMAFFCLPLWLVGCNSDVFIDEMSVSGTAFELDGESDSVVIEVNKPIWNISNVEVGTPTHKEYLFGTLYDKDGNKVFTNTLLDNIKNEILGKVVCKTYTNTLTLKCDDRNRLCVSVDENLRDTAYCFQFELSDGFATKQISFVQKQSAGYSFDHIEYSYKPDSYTSYTKGVSYNLINDTKDSIKGYYPIFYGMPIDVSFVSDDVKAFSYLGNDYSVQIPTAIVNGNLQYNDVKIPFSRIVTQIDSEFKDVAENVIYPPGLSKIDLSVDYVLFYADYTLYIRSKATNQLKTIKGSLCCERPTGKYTFIFNDKVIK